MIVVRNTFIAKPGSASKLVAQLKDASTVAPFATNVRVMSDLVGDMNTVVLEYQVANMAEFEARMEDYATNEAFRARMKGYTDLYISGRREMFQVL